MYISHLCTCTLIVALMQSVSVFFNTIIFPFFTQQEETSCMWTNSSEAEGIGKEKKVNQSLTIEQSTVGMDVLHI